MMKFGAKLNILNKVKVDKTTIIVDKTYSVGQKGIIPCFRSVSSTYLPV